MRRVTVLCLLSLAGCADSPEQAPPILGSPTPECATDADCIGVVEPASSCMTPICIVGAGACAVSAIPDCEPRNPDPPAGDPPGTDPPTDPPPTDPPEGVYGDALQYLAKGKASEAVDIEVDGEFAYLCGGFGVRVNDVRDPAEPVFADGALSRCQRTALGPQTAGGRIVWFAHHGDTWVPTPFLATYLRTEQGGLQHVDTISESTTLFEGMVFHDGFLYVAIHGGGVRIYSVAADGIPTLATTLEGLTNAWKLDADKTTLYVADGEGGVALVDISEPTSPAIVAQMDTTGVARDIDYHEGRLYVALGTLGVGIFDVADDALSHVATIDANGSVQAVSVDDGVLAVAAWSHVAMYTTSDLALIGTERVKPYPGFETDFGIAMRDDVAYVAEWTGMHTVRYVPGLVAPDLDVSHELLDFGSKTGDVKIVLVRNRGQLDLEVNDIQVEPDVFSVEPTTLTVPPGGVDLFEVTYTGPGTPVQGMATLLTNDPDPYHDPFTMLLLAGKSGGKIGVGDPLTASFSFLDPSGANQLDALKGNVVILAYFALF